jgi:predicted dehydrogenase
MPIRSRRGPAAIVLILAAIAACNGAASGSGSPAATALPAPAATPAAAATVSLAGPLEDLVPDEVGGVQLVKTTVHGPDLGELDPEEAANYASVLENVDGPLEAFAVVSANGEGLAIAAWRMEGTDGRQLGESFIGFVVGLGETQVEDITIEGKEVKRVTPADANPIHVYVTGEVMFVVQAADPALVEDAFAALP